MVAFVGFLLFISVSAAPQGGEMYDAETDCFTQYPSITRGKYYSFSRKRFK